MWRSPTSIATLALAGSVLLPGAARAEPVLLVSIDGLRPGDVIEASQRGLNIPTLRRFVTNGAYASAVTPSTPTVTYPNHTTMLTGVSPARHGIVSNTSFDPKGINQGGWYWYADDIKAPTLWDAASAKRLTTLNVHWPVSVNAKVTWNLPQIWRTGHEDDRKLMAALATPGLLTRTEAVLGPYAQGIDESIEGDENRARFAAKLIIDHKPWFATVYLTAYDNAQHRLGPDHKDAHAVLERIDAALGKIIAAARTARPDTIVAIASDHGFVPLTTAVNLTRLFADEGLLTLGPDNKIADWQAQAWLSGGSAYVRVAKPDQVARVAEALARIKARPDLHIADVLDAAAIAKLGGDPDSHFMIQFEPGWQGEIDPAKPLLSPTKYKGTHGYSSALPQMKTSFLIEGAGLKKKGDLGAIDIRQVAPTLAGILGVSIKAELKPIF